jgi:hypothetical protein
LIFQNSQTVLVLLGVLQRMVVAVDPRFLQDQLLVGHHELPTGFSHLPARLRELIVQRPKLVLSPLPLLLALHLVECTQLGELRT